MDAGTSQGGLGAGAGGGVVSLGGDLVLSLGGAGTIVGLGGDLVVSLGGRGKVCLAGGHGGDASALVAAREADHRVEERLQRQPGHLPRLRRRQSSLAPGVGRVSFHTGTGNDVPRLVTNLTDFFEENKEFSMILGKIWNFNVVSD